MVAQASQEALKKEGFFISCPGGRTALQRGDELTLLADNAPGNVLFHRGRYGLAIRSEEGQLPITGAGRKVFSRDEIRLLAIGLAVGAGLAIEEVESKNPVFQGNNITFRFV